MAIEYYSWAGLEDNKYYFVIRPIERADTKSSRYGYIPVERKKVLYTNFSQTAPEGVANVEIYESNIFDTLEEAMQNIFKGIFNGI
jgi:hypothetical protein